MQDIRPHPWTSIGNRELRRVVVEEICPDGDLAIIPARLCKRVYGVTNEVKNDLPQLDAITFYYQRTRSEHSVQGNVPICRLCCWNSDHFGHDLVQVNIPSFDLSLGEKTAQALYDLGRPVIITLDISQNRLDFLHIRQGRVEHQFYRFGVVENGSQRLIEFMGDRSRQFAGESEPIHSGEFGYAL
jgi:hypothetical protein